MWHVACDGGEEGATQHSGCGCRMGWWGGRHMPLGPARDACSTQTFAATPREGAAGLAAPDTHMCFTPPQPACRWLIIGPHRSGSSFHVDPNATCAWNAVVSGAKKWILFPPGRGAAGCSEQGLQCSVSVERLFSLPLAGCMFPFGTMHVFCRHTHARRQPSPRRAPQP